MRYQGLITEDQASKLAAYVRRISHGGRVEFDLQLKTSDEGGPPYEPGPEEDE